MNHPTVPHETTHAVARIGNEEERFSPVDITELPVLHIVSFFHATVKTVAYKRLSDDETDEVGVDDPAGRAQLIKVGRYLAEQDEKNATVRVDKENAYERPGELSRGHHGRENYQRVGQDSSSIVLSSENRPSKSTSFAAQGNSHNRGRDRGRDRPLHRSRAQNMNRSWNVSVRSAERFSHPLCLSTGPATSS
jgi:hypothetical protein